MNKSNVKFFSITCYIMLLIINGFMFYFLGTYFNLIFLAALIVVPVFSYINGMLAARFAEVSVSGAKYVESRNDEFVFSINVKNKSVFFSNSCVMHISISNSFHTDTITHSVTLPLVPLSAASVTYPVNAGHCGIIKIDIPNIWVYDLLNIFSFPRAVNITREIPVFPNAGLVNDEFSTDFSVGSCELSESQSKGYDFSEISDVREYIPGDKLQDIHWKLTAKKDTLMVKEHVSLASKQLVFYIELAKTSADLLDLILDYAYSIGTYLCQNAVPFTYIWYSVGCGECKLHLIHNKQELYNTIYEMLYEAPINDFTDIRGKIKQMSGYENFIIIGTDYVLENKKEADRS